LHQESDGLPGGIKHSGVSSEDEFFAFTIGEFFEGGEVTELATLVVSVEELEVFLLGIDGASKVALTVVGDDRKSGWWRCVGSRGKKREKKGSHGNPQALDLKWEFFHAIIRGNHPPLGAAAATV